ncbi:hypothetical protein BU24DRAFT_468287 [Aaosphaeria arxii CBS 175.79]|uniref:Fatty acid desaturase domain-containing protein n=1 Tax=Aaosphaeria arxii CBS 175.79 TaxID=1450172 RepID=A0A6A5X8V6_9PLEO|nr:uncharacterized protein BU24DRAFT_468287 [Aaosphaeria arxii CBS 175.79]KAF2009316.1 hypothetical protein BU24DRAFT_468287 [Aaosphaeria arxii CBS 175.79]
MTDLYFKLDQALTVPDRLVLETLQRDREQYQKASDGFPIQQAGIPTGRKSSVVNRGRRVDSASPQDALDRDHQTIELLRSLNDPGSSIFEPTVFASVDTSDIKSPFLRKWMIDPYTRWGRRIVRVDTDVVMLTHLIIYFATSVPSAIYLFYSFRWWHGLLHLAMQGYYMGPYTLLMHQHIHMRGVLNKRLGPVDHTFPYILDPLMGHTWNSYFFHHVKHHHIEGNGPNDLSSTVRYQRDDVWHFLQYVGRFYFLVWFDLPRYFIQRKKPGLAIKAGGCEIANYAFLLFMFTRINATATTFVFLIPLLFMRLALMVGNWGQHAFVDELKPDSDFRSSITLVDVPSNRHCYNDGYHTSHHLNPLRHWRDHPMAFLKQKKQYADEHALVFYNIDYFMLTITLLTKNYMHLARCLVPMGEQTEMTMEERAEMLRSKTKRFTEEDIAEKWGKQYARLS